MIWGKCGDCGGSFDSYHAFATHSPCGTFPGQSDIGIRSSQVNAQWGDADAVMVHVNAKTGEVSYPGHHKAKLRDGYERQYLRSLPEMNKFEREHGVTNHRMHYDNNGRAVDDTVFGERLTH